MFMDEETEGQEVKHLVKASHLGQPLMSDSGDCAFNPNLLAFTLRGWTSRLDAS